MGENWKQWQILFYWAPKSLWKVTAAMKLKDACSLEGKLWQTLESVLKSRDTILPPKVCIVKAMVFPVVMYRGKSWTIKKAEHQRIDAFELWCWKLLRVPWTQRSNQSILKEINPEYSLEGLMLKLQYFGHLMRKADSLKKILMLGKSEGNRRSRWQRMRWLMASPSQWTWVWANSGRQRTEKPGMLQFIGLQRVGRDLATEQQQQTAYGGFLSHIF